MSRASGAVRFNDGTVRFCIYNGTSDVMLPTLYDTLNEAWDAWQNRTEQWPDPEEPVEDVEIYSDYGGGFWWAGKAGRNAIDPHCTMPWGDDFGNDQHEHFDGTPEWFTAACNDGTGAI